MKKIATLGLFAGVLAFAQAPAPNPSTETHADHGRFIQQMMNRLGLSDSQKQQANALFQQSRQTAQPIREQLKKNREALSAAIKANDHAQIQQLSVQQGQLRGQLLSIRADTRAKFLATLTPEQRTRFESERPMNHRLNPRHFRRGE
jgi:Spy/CpxP family protein refolding chaperone